MSLRQAFSQSRWLTFALLAATGWVLFKAITVLNTMQPFWAPGEPGQTATAGVVGLLVMAATLALLVTLLTEAGEPSFGPETWPPEPES